MQAIESVAEEDQEPTKKQTIRQLAEMVQMSKRQLERGRRVLSNCIPEVEKAINDERINLHQAEQIIRFPVDEQLPELTAVLNGERKVKREPPGLARDMGRIVKLINSMCHRWRAEDRPIIRLFLEDCGRQLVEGPDQD